MVSDPQNGISWLENLTQGSDLSAVWPGLSFTGINRSKMTFWMAIAYALGILLIENVG